jgi:hypothetical protein
MSTVTRLADPIDFAPLATTLLDSAAAIEQVVQNDKRQIQALKRQARRAHQRAEHARQWIVTLRQSHRTSSHAKTAGLFKQALAELQPDAVSAPVSLTLFSDSLAV